MGEIGAEAAQIKTEKDATDPMSAAIEDTNAENSTGADTQAAVEKTAPVKKHRRSPSSSERRRHRRRRRERE